MKLSDYLERRGETAQQFAARTGLPRSTVKSIRDGGGATATSALAIIQATGGIVTLEDLTPAKARARESAA